MTSAVRALLMTPDYPPARGGIQYLLHGLVSHAERIRFDVVTFGARAQGVSDDDGIRRVAPRGPRAVAVATLNAACVCAAHRLRPHVLLCGHIVTAPAAATTGIPFVQYVHASELAMRPRLATFAVRRAAATIALGEHGRQLALAAGAAPERIEVIPPGIDLPPVAPAPAVRLPMIVCVARLEDRYKGFDVLLRALALVRSRVPEATLTLAGDGPLRASLEALARANGCADAVRFAGAVSDGERDRLLREAAVFAMPSRLPPGGGGEGFGIAYLEAAAHGTPVVAGNVGGALDAVVDGITGLLIAPDDHVAVADALCELLLDRDRAATLGAAGRARAEGFAWPAIVPRVEDVLIRAASATR